LTSKMMDNAKSELMKQKLKMQIEAKKELGN